MTLREQEILFHGIKLGISIAYKFGGDETPEERFGKVIEKIAKSGTGKKKGVKRGPHIKWTEAQDEIIRRMSEEGKTDNEIGKVVGQSGIRVGVRRVKLGIKKGADFKWRSKRTQGDGIADLGQKEE